MDRPVWLPEMSEVVETIDGLFGRDEGDTEVIEEAFAFAIQQERERLLGEVTAWATTHAMMQAGRGNTDDVLAFVDYLRAVAKLEAVPA